MQNRKIISENSIASRKILPDNELAALGGGEVAYVRHLSTKEVIDLFPNVTNLPSLAPGSKLWALLNADGSPIMLSNSRAIAEANAMEHNLVPLSVH